MGHVPITEQGRQRYDALLTLLALPDLPCLPRRSYMPRFPGDAARRERLKRDLARAYTAHRTLEYWNADGEILSVQPLFAATSEAQQGRRVAKSA